MGPSSRPLWRRIASGVGAAMVGDLILGMTCFSAISVAALWYFSIGWLRLVDLYAAAGLAFGSALQWDLAWIGAVGGLPLLGGVIYLGYRAMRLPPAVYRAGRDGRVRAKVASWFHGHRPARAGPLVP
jgi:hypothetical protein